MEDLIIVGGGPAGLTAGLYAARARLKTLLLEKLSPGGQVLITDWVENFPGFPEGLSGFELVDRMKRQAEHFGLVIQNSEVIGFRFDSGKRFLTTNKETLESKALILACGATPRKLGIEGEELFTGRGISYCATCDGPFYRDQEVAVIGGGDTAVQEAIFLTRFASKVYLIHRRDEFRAAKVLQERADAEEKIQFIMDNVPSRIVGEAGGVKGLELLNKKSGEKTFLEIQGVFVFIGYTPNSQLLEGLVDLDGQGFVLTDNDMGTSVPGVFAAGDIRSKLLRQISTAVGEGATAAVAAERFIEEL